MNSCVLPTSAGAINLAFCRKGEKGALAAALDCPSDSHLHPNLDGLRGLLALQSMSNPLDSAAFWASGKMGQACRRKLLGRATLQKC